LPQNCKRCPRIVSITVSKRCPKIVHLCLACFPRTNPKRERASGKRATTSQDSRKSCMHAPEPQTKKQQRSKTEGGCRLQTGLRKRPYLFFWWADLLHPGCFEQPLAGWIQWERKEKCMKGIPEFSSDLRNLKTNCANAQNSSRIVTLGDPIR